MVKINELRVSFTIFEQILLIEKCKILQNNTMLLLKNAEVYS